MAKGNGSLRRNALIAVATLIAVIAFGFYWSNSSSTNDASQDIPMVEVTVPALSGDAKAGKQIFNENCAACHGDNAAGRDGMGPPLIHKIYEPSHHGDMAFVLAPRRGVRAHHWPFGDMPPIDGLSDADILKIITYIRIVQRANGIS